jgi:hypothetical protein
LIPHSLLSKSLVADSDELEDMGRRGNRPLAHVLLLEEQAASGTRDDADPESTESLDLFPDARDREASPSGAFREKMAAIRIATIFTCPFQLANCNAVAPSFLAW